MTRELTCIICPMGCQLRVELDDNKHILSIEGYTCPRGKVYANTECTAPKRTITTTVAVEGGGVVSVKTDSMVPKELVMECMKVINSVKAPVNSPMGTVIIENILGTGVNVITTKEV